MKRDLSSADLCTDAKRARKSDDTTSQDPGSIPSTSGCSNGVVNPTSPPKAGNSIETPETDNRPVRTKPTSPAPSNFRRKSHKTHKPTGRTKKCGECAGCNKDDCGVCQTCRINAQFQDKLKLGMAECRNRICQNPIPLTVDLVKNKKEVGGGGGKSAMEAMMAEQDDGTCPFREVDGVLIDFRCYLCKKLPRAGMANRSELYRHYSVYHFSGELIAEFGNSTTCNVAGCRKAGTTLSGKNLADHMGQVHNHVDKYLPEENRIPMKVQRSGGGRAKPVRKGRSKGSNNFIFPQIPLGYDPLANKILTQDIELEVEGYMVTVERIKTNLRVPSLIDVDSGVSASISYVSCAICYNKAAQTVAEMVEHLAVDHRMSLNHIPGDDKVGFLLNEGIIRKLDTVLDNNPDQTRVLAEEGNSVDFSPIHGFPDDEQEAKEGVSPIDLATACADSHTENGTDSDEESTEASTTDKNEEESLSNDNLVEVDVDADTKEIAKADIKCDNVVEGDSNQNDIVKSNKENIVPA